MNDKKRGTDKLREELETVKKEVEQYKNKYLRALADYQNFEKRIVNEHEQLIQKGKQEIILKLLPFLDGLEKAEIFIKDNGLKQVKEMIFQVIKSEKIEELSVLGQEFDPHLAEAIEVVAGEKDDMVVEVARKGYKLGDKILRVAQVKVSKAQISNVKSQNQNSNP